MPNVTFSYPARNIKTSASMFSPKRIQELDQWYKTARKSIPEIPDPSRTDWQVSNTISTVGSVVFELHNSIGHRAVVTIDRRAPSLRM